MSSTRKHTVVFSGGSAANNLIDVFKALSRDRGGGLHFVLPISDNGGSTSEILRVFGGPGIGDVRSRLVRLVPEDTEDEELICVKQILNYRLPPSRENAFLEWLAIVEGTHVLWKGISSEKRELLRSFFNLLNMELLKRQRPSSSFNFHSASTGNLFLTGARIFFGSFESAIYLFRSITGIPENVQVIPAINSNFAYHIAAELEDGTVITGQNQISHPSVPSASMTPPDQIATPDMQLSDDDDEFEDANLPGCLASLRTQNIEFSKKDETQLSSPVKRIWYINPYGQEIRPPVNPKVLSSIENSEAIIYSIGSLYTSLIPCLIPRHLGRAIATCPRNTPRVLLLNGSHDRETGPNHDEFTATTFVRAIVGACYSSISPGSEPPLDPKKVEWNRFVTHVIYMEGNGAPRVDVPELVAMGIQCLRVYGKRNPEGDGKGMLYDAKALAQALEAVLATRGKRVGNGRRLTVDSVNGQESPGRK
ncbi:hypothetical protein RUND412_009003 [Rhizina undulata]